MGVLKISSLYYRSILKEFLHTLKRNLNLNILMDHQMWSLYKMSALSAEPEYFKAQPFHFQVSFCSADVKGYLFFLSMKSITPQWQWKCQLVSSSTSLFNSTSFFLHNSISAFLCHPTGKSWWGIWDTNKNIVVHLKS